MLTTKTPLDPMVKRLIRAKTYLTNQRVLDWIVPQHRGLAADRFLSAVKLKRKSDVAAQRTPSSCPQKRVLLDEYLRKMGTHNTLTREYAQVLASGANGDLLATLRNKVNEARADYSVARENYANHRGIHGC